MQLITSAILLGAGAGLVAAHPAVPSRASEAELSKRATCTFTSAASAIAGKKSCSAIVLSNIVVPAGTTLDMTGLTAGTTVTFSVRSEKFPYIMKTN